MRRARVDANQAEIVEYIRARGATVVLMHTVGEGMPDLLVGWGRWTMLVEVKTKTGTLTPRQKEWHAAWKGGKVYIIRSIDEAETMLRTLE